MDATTALCFVFALLLIGGIWWHVGTLVFRDWAAAKWFIFFMLFFLLLQVVIAALRYQPEEFRLLEFLTASLISLAMWSALANLCANAMYSSRKNRRQREH